MLLDSNIIIYALNSASPKHRLAQQFITHNLNRAIISQQNIFESIRVLTHPKYPRPFKPQQAVAAIRAITDQMRVICPSFETTQLALELIKKYGVTGSQVFDAYLVATAMDNGETTIANDNVKHLQIYEQIKVVNPFAY